MSPPGHCQNQVLLFLLLMPDPKRDLSWCGTDKCALCVTPIVEW